MLIQANEALQFLTALQQYLPFTVLKLSNTFKYDKSGNVVATVLTVYGIETIIQGGINKTSFLLQQYLPFTVLKPSYLSRLDATGLKLQQYLPFTVLKPSFYFYSFNFFKALQQYLPFTVLKLKYSTRKATY